MKKRKIYTEYIHHVSCQKCDYCSNTGDCSREFTKNDAVNLFEIEGWVYIKHKGWLCHGCSSLIAETPGKE